MQEWFNNLDVSAQPRSCTFLLNSKPLAGGTARTVGVGPPAEGLGGDARAVRAGPLVEGGKGRPPFSVAVGLGGLVSAQSPSR